MDVRCRQTLCLSSRFCRSCSILSSARSLLISSWVLMWKRIYVVRMHSRYRKAWNRRARKPCVLRHIVLGKDGEEVMGSVGFGLSERYFSSRAMPCIVTTRQIRDTENTHDAKSFRSARGALLALSTFLLSPSCMVPSKLRARTRDSSYANERRNILRDFRKLFPDGRLVSRGGCAFSARSNEAHLRQKNIHSKTRASNIGNIFVHFADLIVQCCDPKLQPQRMHPLCPQLRS